MRLRNMLTYCQRSGPVPGMSKYEAVTSSTSPPFTIHVTNKHTSSRLHSGHLEKGSTINRLN